MRAVKTCSVRSPRGDTCTCNATYRLLSKQRGETPTYGIDGRTVPVGLADQLGQGVDVGHGPTRRLVQALGGEEGDEHVLRVLLLPRPDLQHPDHHAGGVVVHIDGVLRLAVDDFLQVGPVAGP